MTLIRTLMVSTTAFYGFRRTAFLALYSKQLVAMLFRHISLEMWHTMVVFKLRAVVIHKKYYELL